MSKNSRCPTLAGVSTPALIQTMLPQMALPQGANFTLDWPLSRSQVPVMSSASAGLAAMAAPKARPRMVRGIMRGLLQKGGGRKLLADFVSNTNDDVKPTRRGVLSSSEDDPAFPRSAEGGRTTRRPIS